MKLFIENTYKYGVSTLTYPKKPTPNSNPKVHATAVI